MSMSTTLPFIRCQVALASMSEVDEEPDFSGFINVEASESGSVFMIEYEEWTEAERISQMVKRILLPLKFTHVTDNAFAMAIKMAKCCQARLHILHVLDHRLRDPGVTDDQIAEFTRAAENQFKENYRQILGNFKNFYFNCWEGDIAMETAKFADSIGADFIIIGCHVRGDKPSHARLGEVAHALFQWAPCPVMLVPCKLHRGKVTLVRQES